MKLDTKCPHCGKEILVDLDYDIDYCEHCEGDFLTSGLDNDIFESKKEV